MSDNPVRDAISEAIADHEIILFMKGTPEQPMCGFSARTAAALEALGAPFAAVEAGMRGFGGVRDRLELVAEIGGVRYVNDTTATAPAAAIAALRAVEPPVVLIAGGSEKHTDFAAFAAAAAERAAAIVLLRGDATPRLREALAAAGVEPGRLHGDAGSMDEAVRLATDLATPGATVLLSPACASFGMFRDEFHRGEAFRTAVASDERRATSAERADAQPDPQPRS